MEVFRAGKHVSSSGAEREWSVDDLVRMAEAYDPASHQAPIVVGHPKDNDPAFGWVKALKVDGNTLLAMPDQVAPEFAELVKAGRYKKRSISLYPNGTLRHVGFLGAQPPAVKGLKDIEFAGLAADTYEFADEEEAGMTEVERLRKELAEEKKKRELAEGKAANAETSFAELQAKTKKQEIDAFIDQGVKDGKILSAWKDQGLAEFMGALDGQTETYEFCEGKKEAPVEWFKRFIHSFAEHPLFKEMAKPKKEEKPDDFSEDETLGKEIAAKVNPAKA
jgi:Arc/MetJ-type ribon-helix-helix transcriptional regulator